jgi:very-short-patch-repair endonuclease/predicted transcriptional regulator of viral defense system
VCRVIDGEPRERLIARVAARQRGLITQAQLLAAGVSRKTIQRWVRSGRLYSVHRGVYLVGHEMAPPLAIELAAVMACAPYSFLSHFSGSKLWGVLDVKRPTIDVTVVGRNAGLQQGITVHRTRHIDRADLTRREGIPVTRPGRLLLDLADVASTGQLERAWDEAHSRDLVTPGQMQKLVRRSPGRHGIPRIKSLLEREATGISKSLAERRLGDLIRRANLPNPETNLLLGRYEFDFVWREQRYILELDGGHHDRPRRRDYDNRRDSELRNDGWRVDHVSRYEVMHEPEAVIARLAAALASAARGPAPRPPAGTSAG